MGTTENREPAWNEQVTDDFKAGWAAAQAWTGAAPAEPPPPGVSLDWARGWEESLHDRSTPVTMQPGAMTEAEAALSLAADQADAALAADVIAGPGAWHAAAMASLRASGYELVRTAAGATVPEPVTGLPPTRWNALHPDPEQRYAAGSALVAGRTIAEVTVKTWWARNLHWSEDVETWEEATVTFTDGGTWSFRCAEAGEIDSSTLTDRDPYDEAGNLREDAWEHPATPQAQPEPEPEPARAFDPGARVRLTGPATFYGQPHSDNIPPGGRGRVTGTDTDGTALVEFDCGLESWVDVSALVALD